MALDQEIDQSGLRNQINLLRNWQCKRLLLSYDALYQQKNYRPAIDFFTDELYGANDFSQRDKDIKKVLPMMEAVLSNNTIRTFEIALKLNVLSYQLDIGLVRQLSANECISSNIYAQAYKACDNQALREKQLDFIKLLANDLAGFANRGSIMLMLKLSRKPAKIVGLGELQNSLERGAKAFRKIGKLDLFITPILEGEKLIMQQLFNGVQCLPEV
jgi:hypothetical protein